VSKTHRHIQRMITKVPKAGRTLRRIREGLGLTMRDVMARSKVSARRLHNRDYELSLNALSEMEAGGRVPHIYRLASLAGVYGRSLNSLLALYHAEVVRGRKRRK
jgi:transcriptional regulator with XRE-family HTH domain